MILPIQYHRQDDRLKCGSACAQMVLESLSPGSALIRQQILYDDSRLDTPAGELPLWATPPDGLVDIMNQYDPRGPGFFHLYANVDNQTLTSQITHTIDTYQVSPIALVFDRMHWVVVYGHEQVNNPVTQTRQLKLYVNNPSPSLDMPINHGRGDFCSTDGHVSDIEILEDVWYRDYLTPVDVGLWNGLCLAVCDPFPVGPVERKISAEKKVRQNTLIGASLAMENSMVAIKQYNLFSHKIDNKTLDGLEPGKPYLVKRLDRLNDYYYMVPILSNKKLVAFINIDGRFGNFRDAGSGQEFQQLNIKPMPEEKIFDIIGKRILTKKGTINVFPEVTSISPFLVWQPCRESLSTFLPFHLINIDNHRFYMRLDGNLFPSLNRRVVGL